MAYLARGVGEQVKHFIRLHREAGNRCVVPDLIPSMITGLYNTWILVDGLCSPPVAPCPVLHRFLNCVLSWLAQMVGALALDDHMMMLSHDTSPGEATLLAEELESVEVELEGLVDDLAAWICDQSVSEGLASDFFCINFRKIFGDTDMHKNQRIATLGRS